MFPPHHPTGDRCCLSRCSNSKALHITEAVKRVGKFSELAIWNQIYCVCLVFTLKNVFFIWLAFLECTLWRVGVKGLLEVNSLALPLMHLWQSLWKRKEFISISRNVHHNPRPPAPNISRHLFSNRLKEGNPCFLLFWEIVPCYVVLQLHVI